jgi:hypothetical protein
MSKKRGKEVGQSIMDQSGLGRAPNQAAQLGPLTRLKRSERFWTPKVTKLL